MVRKSCQQVSAVLRSDEYLEAVTITVDSADESSTLSAVIVICNSKLMEFEEGNQTIPGINVKEMA